MMMMVGGVIGSVQKMNSFNCSFSRLPFVVRMIKAVLMFKVVQWDKDEGRGSRLQIW